MSSGFRYRRSILCFHFDLGLEGIWLGIAGAFAAQAIGLGSLLIAFSDFTAIAEGIQAGARSRHVGGSSVAGRRDHDRGGGYPMDGLVSGGSVARGS